MSAPNLPSGSSSSAGKVPQRNGSKSTKCPNEPIADLLEETSIQVALVLRSPGFNDLGRELSAMTKQLPVERAYLGRAAWERRFAASAQDSKTVGSFADAHDLKVVETDLGRRLVVLEGSLASVIAAFEHDVETTDREIKTEAGPFRRRTHPNRVPPMLDGIVEGVFGIDNLPRFLRGGLTSARAAATDNPAVTGAGSASDKPTRGGTTPGQIKNLYRFPQEADGQGQTIGIVLLGGGFYMEDMRQFFGPDLPEIEVVELAGAKNDPAPKGAIRTFLSELRSGQAPSGAPDQLAQIWWTLEATVDIQLAASFAPGAKLVLYFTSNDELGKIEAVSTALAGKDQDVQVLSCSWGASEADLDLTFMRVLDGYFQAAALRGVSVCYASGDKGANPRDGQPTCEFPASSPHVLACGGTALPPPPEQAWNESRGSRILASGGGFSEVFPRPAWQDSVEGIGIGTETGRGLPDVAAKADYTQGYDLKLAGGAVKGGGTSAATPLWAGLLACLNQALGTQVGWFTPLVYGPLGGSALRTCTIGGNGTFDSASGWDPVTGLGSPDGQALARALAPQQSTELKLS